MQNWFTSRFLRRCSLWCSTDSCGQIYFITFWTFVFISAHLSIKHHIFRTLLTLDKRRYQAREWNIMKFYLLIPKHLIIQLVKYQIDILNLNTTFWHCKKNPITFEQGFTSVVSPIGRRQTPKLNAQYVQEKKTRQKHWFIYIFSGVT